MTRQSVRPFANVLAVVLLVASVMPVAAAEPGQTPPPVRSAPDPRNVDPGSPPSGASPDAPAIQAAFAPIGGGAFIDNGVIELGVNPEGHLNVDGGPPSAEAVAALDRRKQRPGGSGPRSLRVFAPLVPGGEMRPAGRHSCGNVSFVATTRWPLKSGIFPQGQGSSVLRPGSDSLAGSSVRRAHAPDATVRGLRCLGFSPARSVRA